MNTIFKFNSPNCAGCRTMEKPFELLKALIPGVAFRVVEIIEEPDLAAKYGIRKAPTFVLADEAGSIIKSRQGACTMAELQRWVEDV